MGIKKKEILANRSKMQYNRSNKRGIKMKRIRNKLMIAFIVFFSILLLSNLSNAAGLKLKNLDYQVNLNSDGTADVVENWKIYIEDTNTLFKTFEIDKSKYKEITNVSVEEIKSSRNVNFKRIYQEKYHVDKNCFYALINSKGQFEIAWGAHAEDTTRTYQIRYTIVDAVKNYADCSEFYWQFISTESEIPANIVTGTITLPYEVSNKEDLKAWAHGPLNGNIVIVSKDTVKFEVEDLTRNTMLEARVVIPTNVFANNQNRSNQEKLQSILAQEQEWADEANRIREKRIKEKENTRRILIIATIIFNGIGLVLAIIIIRKIIKYHKKLKEHPVLKPEMEMKYFRDIPDGSATPGEAGFLYYFKNTSLQYNMSKIISASMLDLCLKGYLSFETIAEKKNQIRVTLKEKNTENLAEDEKTIYELLEKVANKETKSFTMKDFEKYARNHSSSVLSKINKIETQVKKQQEEKKNYSKELIENYNKWMGKGVGYIGLATVGIFIMQILVIPAIIASIYSFIISSRYHTLTQKRSK